MKTHKKADLYTIHNNMQGFAEVSLKKVLP